MQQFKPLAPRSGQVADACLISSIQQADKNPREHHNSDIDHKDKQEKRAKSQVIGVRQVHQRAHTW